MMRYEETFYNAAKASGWNAANVLTMNYVAVASASGVVIDAKGNSPKDFFYEQVRGVVATLLKSEEAAAALEAKRLKLAAQIAKDLSLSSAQVVATEDGFLVKGLT